MRTKALIIAVILVLGALSIRFYKNSNQTLTYIPPSPPVLDELGSEHSHVSLAIFINSTPLDLSPDKYAERSEYAHFHQGEGGTYIHKHARGVTLIYFLSTLGITLNNACLEFDKEKYCNNEVAKLNVMVNRKLIRLWNKYELRDGDKILIDYGITSPDDMMLEANSIPDLPDDLSQNE